MPCSLCTTHSQEFTAVFAVGLQGGVWDHLGPTGSTVIVQAAESETQYGKQLYKGLEARCVFLEASRGMDFK